MVSEGFLTAVVLGSVVVVATSTVLAWRQRPKPGATAFAVTMLAATWWVTTAAIGLFTTDPAMRLFWAKVEWAGVVAFPVAWLVFALEYTGYSEWLTRRRLAALAVVPAVTLALTLTNGLGHTLVYESTRYAAFGSLSLFVRTFGPWFWVHAAYALAVMVAGAVLVARLAASGRLLYRGQATALMLVVAAPLVGTVVHLAGRSPVAGFDPTPYTFVISAAAGLAALTQFSFLDAVPVPSRVARRSVVENVDAGVLVADTTGHVVDANPRARELLAGGEIGEPVDRWLPASVPQEPTGDLEALSSAATGSGSAGSAGDGEGRGSTASDRTVVTVDRANRERHYEVDVTALNDAHDAVTGWIYLVRDVTDRRTRLQRLNVLNRVLRHNLRNEMNVVYGLADRLEQGGDPSTIAGEIRAKARDLTDMSEKAREIDAILDRSDRGTADLGRIVAIEAERVASEYRDATVETAVPEGTLAVDRLAAAVVRNLVENAVEHNPSPEPWVRVDVAVADGRARVDITDDGPGIPAGERAAIDADAETQLDHASGLGLWIARWGAATAGGSLSVADREAGGTVVTVTFPLSESSDDAGEDAVDPTRGPSGADAVDAPDESPTDESSPDGSPTDESSPDWSPADESPTDGSEQSTEDENESDGG